MTRCSPGRSVAIFHDTIRPTLSTVGAKAHGEFGAASAAFGAPNRAKEGIGVARIELGD